MFHRLRIVASVLLIATTFPVILFSQENSRQPRLVEENVQLRQRIAELERKVAVLADRLQAIEKRLQISVVVLPKPANRSTDLKKLRAALARDDRFIELAKRFEMGCAMLGDFVGPAEDVGGSPASVMVFFRDETGRYYRVFNRRRIMHIAKPAAWISKVVDAGQPPPEAWRGMD